MAASQLEIATALVSRYQDVRWQYQQLAERASRFLAWKIDDHFKGASWPYLHLSQARAKSPASLFRNLMKVDLRYEDAEGQKIPLKELRLEHIGDLAAVRMIFYFGDDLVNFTDAVRKGSLEAWFGARSKDWYDPRNPPRLKKHDAFGYASHHFPVVHTLNTAFSRIAMAASPPTPSDLQCEVQLRTVLQHAWAEGEHDIRYKGGEMVSESDRRQWGLVAALVECADDKLAQLKRNQRRPEVPAAVALSTPPALSVGAYVSFHEPHEPEPELTSDRTLFDLDAAMAVPGFKATQLDRVNAQAPRLRFTYDSLFVRLAAWSHGVVRVQPCLYSDAVATNNHHALEFPARGRTVRERACAPDGTWLPFADSPMANNIGVACMVRSSDGYWLISGRSQTLGFDPGTWGCSASGAFEWRELDSRPSLTAGGCASMAREALEEIGVAIALDRFKYTGLAREMARGGKPQMFFVARVDVPRADLDGFWRVLATDEHDAVEFADDREARHLVDATLWRGRALSPELCEALRRAVALGP